MKSSFKINCCRRLELVLAVYLFKRFTRLRIVGFGTTCLLLCKPEHTSV